VFSLISARFAAQGVEALTEPLLPAGGVVDVNSRTSHLSLLLRMAKYAPDFQAFTLVLWFLL
jgi:hypothetical protein